ncbi:MAG: hypothetical protein NTX50_10960 [Candidatus Sumerlaeota bacterium]|nr:hypothetical protein [Candidatus Sumerlaeota bacterium]
MLQGDFPPNKTNARKAARPTTAEWLLWGLALALLGGCASPSGPSVIGKARIQAPLPPGECRTRALTAAYGDAFSQMQETARKETIGGETIGQWMDSSPYVAARVRRAIQDSKVMRQKFYDDGQAIVTLEMNLASIRAAAIEARSEVK